MFISIWAFSKFRSNESTLPMLNHRTPCKINNKTNKFIGQTYQKKIRKANHGYFAICLHRAAMKWKRSNMFFLLKNYKTDF